VCKISSSLTPFAICNELRFRHCPLPNLWANKSSENHEKKAYIRKVEESGFDF
jgi:hypothetical protein